MSSSASCTVCALAASLPVQAATTFERALEEIGKELQYTDLGVVAGTCTYTAAERLSRY